MSLTHDVCRLHRSRRSGAVRPVGSRQQVGHDHCRWLACEEEQHALKLADHADGIGGCRNVNVRGEGIFSTLRHVAALALVDPAFFRARLAECPEAADPTPAETKKAAAVIERYRRVHEARLALLTSTESPRTIPA